MRIEQLTHFIEVANQQSISKASRKLFISQPSLSTSINNLEEDLGVKLFVRSNSGVQLTTYGQQIIPLARHVVEDVQQIRAIAAQDEQLSGYVSIAAVPAACNAIIMDLIILLKKLHPQLTLLIEETRPKNVISLLLKGDVSLGITSYFHFEQPQFEELFAEKHLKFEVLYEDSLCIYTSKDHPLAAYDTITMAQAGLYPFASFKKDLLPENIFKNITDHTAIQLPEITYRFNDRESIKKIVAEKVAIALLPQSMIYNDLYVQEGLLVPIALSDMDLSLKTGLIYKKDAFIMPAEKKVIHSLKQISHARAENTANHS